MTLNRPTERERGFFMITINNYLNEAFDKLLERTCKDIIQKWSHEGGTFRQAHPALQNTKKVEKSSSAQQEE